MYIPQLNRHLAVCGIQELNRMLDSEPHGFWHVVTVLDHGVAMPRLHRSASCLRLFAADERNPIRQPATGDPTSEMVRDFLNYADTTAPAPATCTLTVMV